VAVAAGDSLDGDRRQSMFDALMDRIAPRFARVELSMFEVDCTDV
jgi:hypothetical protein